MRRLAGFLVLGFLVSCAPVLIPIADRGIGGTGSPAAGVPLATADRGIGGTGIVGVITGFGSIFVDGFEVGYNAATTVDIDGTPASTAALRTGQVVAIDAAGPATALEAESVAVRHEVAGPVQAVSDNGRVVEVAGQSVALEGPLGAGAALRPGAWVAVSGLRRPDGSIDATRIDPSPPGFVRVRGRLVEGPGGLGIGALPVVPAPGISAAPGQFVTVSGRYAGGRLLAGSVAPDLVATDPFAHFGPHVGRVFVESYVSAASGRLSTPTGLDVRAAPSLGAAGLKPSWAVVTLERHPGEPARATGLRLLERPAMPLAPPSSGLERGFHQGSIEGFRPAPVPAHYPRPLVAPHPERPLGAAPFPERLPPGRGGPPSGRDVAPCLPPGVCGPLLGP